MLIGLAGAQVTKPPNWVIPIKKRFSLSIFRNRPICRFGLDYEPYMEYFPLWNEIAWCQRDPTGCYRWALMSSAAAPARR